MEIDVIPTLIDQFREVFEGQAQPGVCWITDGPRESAVFGVIEGLTVEQAFMPLAPGGKSVAAQVEHLRFALDLTYERLQGKNPPADWSVSFNVPPASEEAWKTLQRELRRAYDAVVGDLQKRRNVAVQDWPPIVLAGTAAMTAHNAYHLGAIRQIVRVVGAKK